MLRLFPYRLSTLLRTTSKINIISPIQHFSSTPQETAEETKTSIKRMKSLVALFNNGKGKRAAKIHLQKSIINGTANSIHCNWGLKHLCKNSITSRGLINQMLANQIPVDEQKLTMLIYQLLKEDKKEEAQTVIEIDFPNYGLQPTQITLRTMADADKLSGLGHTEALKRLLKQDGKETALVYLNDLMSTGKSSARQCSWAIKHLCDTAIEAVDLIKRMDEYKIPIDEIILNLLIHQFLSEGKKEEAQTVVEIDFPNYGLKPTDRTYATISGADKIMGIGITSKMKHLLKLEGKQSSKRYLNELLLAKKADIIHCGWGIKMLCDTSDETRGLIDQMCQNNLPPNAIVLNMLIHQLLMENKKDQAQIVLDVDFRKYGLEPNDITVSTMKKADQLAKKKSKIYV